MTRFFHITLSLPVGLLRPACEKSCVGATRIQQYNWVRFHFASFSGARECEYSIFNLPCPLWLPLQVTSAARPSGLVGTWIFASHASVYCTVQSTLRFHHHTGHDR